MYFVMVIYDEINTILNTISKNKAIVLHIHGCLVFCFEKLFNYKFVFQNKGLL